MRHVADKAETEQLQHERSALRRQRARMSALAHSLDGEVEHADAVVAEAAQQVESTRADQRQLAAAVRDATRQLRALEFQVKLLKALRCGSAQQRLANSCSDIEHI